MGFFANMKAKSEAKKQRKEEEYKQVISVRIAGFREGVEKGDREAMFELAKYYSDIEEFKYYPVSEEIETDNKKAYELFSSAGQRMNVEEKYSEIGTKAAYYAILHIIEGKGTPRNYMKAIELLGSLILHNDDVFNSTRKKCMKKIFELRDTLERNLKANPSDTEAAYCLAYLYYYFSGEFSEASYETEEELYRKALNVCDMAFEYGYQNAVYQKVRLMDDNKGGSDLFPKIRTLAELGNPACQYIMTMNMLNKQKNYKKAIEYAEGCVKYGRMYFDLGDIKWYLGVAYYMNDDYDKAEKIFLETAVRQPDLEYYIEQESESYDFLGQICEYHKNDMTKALEYYEKAMQLGSPNGKRHYEKIAGK